MMISIFMFMEAGYFENQQMPQKMASLLIAKFRTKFTG